MKIAKLISTVATSEKSVMVIVNIGPNDGKNFDGDPVSQMLIPIDTKEFISQLARYENWDDESGLAASVMFSGNYLVLKATS